MDHYDKCNHGYAPFIVFTIPSFFFYMTKHQIINENNATIGTSPTGTDYTFGSPELIPVFKEVRVAHFYSFPCKCLVSNFRSSRLVSNFQSSRNFSSGNCFDFSSLNTAFLTRIIRRSPLEQELVTISEHQSSSPFQCGSCGTICSFLCKCFVKSCFVSSLFFWPMYLLFFSSYGFRLPLWYLHALLGRWLQSVTINVQFLSCY